MFLKFYKFYINNTSFFNTQKYQTTKSRGIRDR